MSANPSSRAKKYCVPSVIGITNVRPYYSTYGQYRTDWESDEKAKKAKCACLPRHFLWAGTIYSAIKSCPPWVMENAKNNTTLYIYILSISSRLRLIVNKPAHTISIFCLHIYMTFAYFVRENAADGIDFLRKNPIPVSSPPFC